MGAGSHTHLLQEQSSILTSKPGLQSLESNIIVFVFKTVLRVDDSLLC